MRHIALSAKFAQQRQAPDQLGLARVFDQNKF
jgi:hypothetical protein